MISSAVLQGLQSKLSGELFWDSLHQVMYATDASVYKRLPTAVAFPKNKNDLKLLIHFATEHKIGLIPRAAGTSLAGQCVGEGIVVDLSKHFNKILHFDSQNQTVTVQSGVIRDDLNRYLQDFGLFFGPNTSTSNRCMLGGMVGNNSSGSTSIRYGVTRDKVVALHTILSDGSNAVFEPVSSNAFKSKTKSNTLEGNLYRKIYDLLSPKSVQKQIQSQFPKASIHRRNTGYALDALMQTEVFDPDSPDLFSMHKLLCGSEGTLAFITEITLQLDPLPPAHRLLVVPHFSSISDCMKAIVPIMKHTLYTCEMLDKTILDCTLENLEQQANRFFIQKDPKAVLLLEICAETPTLLQAQKQALLDTLDRDTLSYAKSILAGAEIERALDLRKAGLGVLANMKGDQKAVACIEDTAVALDDLASYIEDFTAIMEKYKQKAVYYAHAGAGEIHLRPILNLKKRADVVHFKAITDAVAELVKKYNGSMSGEHGDGIVRSGYIPKLIGKENFEIIQQIKNSWDPHHIFNPHKIVSPYPMDQALRYQPDRVEPEVSTFLNFSDTQGIVRAAEQCHGSGDCRKSIAAAGTMCPSYRATRNEQDSTRGRANALREFLTQGTKNNPFDHPELKSVLDLCISCKGCAAECPSNVDMAVLKSEFTYQYQLVHGVSLQSRLFAHATRIHKIGSKMRGLVNFVYRNAHTAWLLKKISGIHSKRSLPQLSSPELSVWSKKHLSALQPVQPIKQVFFYIDEFTNYLDAQIGIDALQLLCRLGYAVTILPLRESGRTFISKGFLKEAKAVANFNLQKCKDKVTKKTPLLGLEPSAILTFRDEYLRLADDSKLAASIAPNAILIDEFLASEIKLGNILPNQFTDQKRKIKLHVHCHQKALSKRLAPYTILALPVNYQVTMIVSGCCGMAGSFGYEKEHYDLSMQIGGHSLFPAITKSKSDCIIAATGTSCRHQIWDGTSRKAKHPVSVLLQAMQEEHD